MHKVYKASGSAIVLKAILARGGEGEIWQTDNPDVVTKIYHAQEAMPLEKLETMIASPPHDPTMEAHHVSISWPQEVIYDVNQVPIGFLMPRVSGSLTLSNIYNPKLRRNKAPGFNFYYLHTAAHNIAAIMDSLHARGYVLGDVTTENFLVNDRALCALSDTDSMQVPHGNKVFRCTVGSEGFTPPELIGQDFYAIDRTAYHDRFGLAILIHLLLLGRHPFTGTWPAGEEPLSLDQAIKNGIWPYATGKRLQPSMLSVSLDVIAPPLKAAFLSAFNGEPELRPTAADWKKVLSAARDDLSACAKNSNHYYDHHLNTCPWCARAEEMGLDIYSAVSNDVIEHKVRFNKAVKTDDQRLMTQLWQAHETLRADAAYLNLRGRMQKIDRDVRLLDRFKAACQEGVDDAALFQMIADNPRLETLSAFLHEKINGQSLAVFFQQLDARRKAIVRAQDAIRLADQYFSAVSATPAHEQAIIDTSRALEDILETQGRAVPGNMSARWAIAKQRLESWRIFQHALDKNDFTLHKTWVVHAEKLKGFLFPDDVRMHLEQVQKQDKIHAIFMSQIRKQPYEDAALIALWAQYPAFQKTIFAKEKVFRDRSIEDFVSDAQKRQFLLPLLDHAYATSDVHGILNAWDKNVCGYHPDFKKFKSYAEKSFDAQKRWHKVRRYILEDDHVQIVTLWHDSFTTQAMREGLGHKVRNSFRHQETRRSSFSSMYFPRMRLLENYIDVLFPWPVLIDRTEKRVRTSYVVGVAQSTYATPDLERCKSALNMRYISADKCGEIGRLILPRTMPKPHIFIWAADFTAGGVRPIGSHLYVTHNQNLPTISYDIFVQSFWKRGRTTIGVHIDVNQDMHLPSLDVVATHGRFPIFQDPEAIVLATLPPCCLKMGGRHKIMISSKHPIERDMIFRLQSQEKFFMDNVTFVYNRPQKYA